MSRFKRALAVLATFAILGGQGCTRGVSPEARELSKQTQITIWSVVDDQDAYSDIIANFRLSHPFAFITFKRFRLEEYEDELLNAFAEDRGPDIFLIHNTWVDKYLPKITAAPKTVQAAFQVVNSSGATQQISYEARTIPTISIRSLKNEFPDFVAQDAVRSINVNPDPDSRDVQLEERVVGLPASVDTLGLYYNKDLLNAAGIPTPPETWEEFQAQVKRLTRYANDGSIVRSGAGFGLGSNVERSSDIISLLMMQNGTEMTDGYGRPTFTKTPAALQSLREQPPGLQALQFYSDFANPAKETYTWNATQPNSLDAFVQGTSAFFLGYSYHLPIIRARAPKLNLGISEVPQITGSPEVNFANYWMWTVSKKSKASDIAWLLVNEMTGEKEVPKYLEVAKRPAARKSLLTDQLEDEDVGAFASQVLTAKTWYRGVDPRGAERAMIELLDQAPQAVDINDLRKMLQVAEEKVSQTLR